MRDRALGSLLGLAVGDALGTTLEFTVLDAPPFPSLATGPHRDVIGGGPHRVARGQVTDDTQMACCLAASLKALGRFDARDVAQRYAAWEPIAFDVGMQTGASLEQLARMPDDADPIAGGRLVWSSSTRRKPAGNGSLMRTAPIAVFFADDDEERRRASLVDSAITHFDPRCRLACAAFNAAIVHSFDAAREELAAGARWLLREEPSLAQDIQSAQADLTADLDAAQKDDPELYTPELHLHEMEGFVRVAFRLAFWELVHAPSFEAALIDVVNRGGDADTNGAITGALLGAHYGASAIPER